jgi:chromosome segregation ATPase
MAGAGVSAASEAVAWARAHPRVLVAAAVISALVALPLALAAPSQFHSEGRVLIPASDVVTTEDRQSSVLAIQIEEQARAGLLGATREALGLQGSRVRSVTAVRLKDDDVYLITVSANSAALARRAVVVASDLLIATSDRLAAEQVASLRSQARRAISDLTDRIVANEDERRKLTTRLAGLNRDLERLREGPSGHAARIAQLQRKKERVVAEIGILDADRSFLSSRRGELEDTVVDAERDLVKRESVSQLVAGPSQAGRAAPTRAVVTVAMGTLLGLSVAVIVLLVLERRSPALRSSER